MIDITFFFNDIDIAERDQTGYTRALKDCITRYEPQFLIKALGYPFYKDFIDNQSAPNYQDLINGKEYTVDGKLYKWQGLIQVIGTGDDEIKISPIAMYIYLQWKRIVATKSLQTGETRQLTANSTPLNAVDKMVDAENQMVTIIREMHDYLNNNTTDYPLWDKTRIDLYLLVKNNYFGF